MKPTRLIIFSTIISIMMVGCYSSSPEGHPSKILFDDNWKFELGESPLASNLDFDDSEWRKLDLPHDWSIEGEPKENNASGADGGFYPTGLGWYRKTFNAPLGWENKNVSIYFEGVYMNSEVYINGKSLGMQPYGYTSFDYDLSPYLNLGKENTIAVKVDNSQQKNCRWYSGSGIYRHVWLMVKEPIHIAHWGVTITTPMINESNATVQIKTLIKNETDHSQNITVSSKIMDAKGKHIADQNMKVELQAKDEKEIVQNIPVQNPELWSPETPNLYKAQINLAKNGDIFDSAEESFGVRTISFDVDNGFQLNGKKVLLNGGCVHHDNGSLGAKAYDRAEVKKVELLKSAGFNAVRTAHNPPSEAFLHACDSLGLLVIDEIFDGWREMKSVLTPLEHDYAKYFDKWWKHDLSSMVLRDKNHPSIIMWSIGNEIIERESPEAVETAKMLSTAVKSIDNTRPVTSAMTTWNNEWEKFDPLMEAHDIAGYNYQLQRAESDHERVPSRIIVNTESYPKNAFFIWNLAQKHDYILGDFVWTAIDYLGESGIGRYYYPGEPDGEHWQANLYPWHGAYCGDVDLTGWRKPISHYRSMLYNDYETLYMAVREPNPKEGEIKVTWWAVWPTWESWTWPGQEGNDMQVEVYSKYPKVRLYLNDKIIDEKATTIEEEFKAVFTVPYEQGELKAVAVAEDKEVESVILKTSGEGSKIKLSADRSIIKADNQDLSYITVEITDDNGQLDPNASNKLNFNITGPGEIIAVDNANLKDTNSYVDTKRHAWNGRASVIIKSTKESGEIILEADSPDLEKATIKLSSN